MTSTNNDKPFRPNFGNSESALKKRAREDMIESNNSKTGVEITPTATGFRGTSYDNAAANRAMGYATGRPAHSIGQGRGKW